MVAELDAASEMGGRKMTREEAAKRFREKAEDHYYVPHLREMYRMAAEALENVMTVLPDEKSSADAKEILLQLDDDGVAKQVWKTEIYFDSEAERDEFDRKLTEGWCPLEWTNAAEKSPAVPGEYIVMIKGAANATALLWDGDEWFLEGAERETYTVTHWMELPEGPRQKGAL